MRGTEGDQFRTPWERDPSGGLVLTPHRTPRAFPQTPLVFQDDYEQPLVVWVKFKVDGAELVLDHTDMGLHDLRPELAIRELQDVPLFTEEPTSLDLRDPDGLCSFLWEFGMVIPPSENRCRGVPDRVELRQVADRLARVRSVAQHALAYLKGEDVRAPWVDPTLVPTPHIPMRTPAGGWSSVASPSLEETVMNFRRSFTVDDAWGYFVGYLNDGLEAFAPHFEAYPSYATELGEPPLPFGFPAPDLYSGLCAQVFNMIVEDLPVLTCANEPCQRDFQRQRGRAAKGQYHTAGVMYCSKECARAQAKRVARRKKKGQR
jgi:hypothetical protein